MRRNIFLYLFLFVSLWVVFQYVNSTKIYENQEAQIARLEEKLQKADSVSENIQGDQSARYFKLANNDNAYSYFESFGVDYTDLEARIESALISQNGTSGNPLVTYDSAAENVFQINKIEVLNHKWVIADFSDGKRWGELILLYDVAKDGSISFETLQSVLYP
ncbi:hypothetical protein [Leeuwenhoekiella sp. MAR_2009_132]|uniref:hypothetical protein n=1 Tax=Leeuwenhoekiella sp. MAR_2009_132 TaxID=1392489 RepID=UPI000491C6DF|nr:hypothetical protein [Leeuwenhoekiella sp. MAR_2009_132]